MKGDTFDKLTGLAVEAKTNFVEAALNVGNASNWMQRETDAYVAWAGDKWTDEGLAAWMASRQAEMNAALRADVAVLTGEADTVEPSIKIEGEAPTAAEILAADEALRKRDDDERPDPRHEGVLLRAVVHMHGPFIQFIERQARACGRGEDLNERIAQHRDELRELFRRDLAAIVKEARSGP